MRTRPWRWMVGMFGLGIGLGAAAAPVDPAAVLVGRLNLTGYEGSIRGLTAFGDRREGTARNRAALDWIEAQLRAYGCSDVTRLRYHFDPKARERPSGPPKADVPNPAVGGGRYRGFEAHTGVNEDPARQTNARLRELERELRDIPELKEVADKVQIEVTEDGLRIQLLEDADGTFYTSGSASLNARGQQLMHALGAQIGKLSNEVRIEGFTDARPINGRSGYSNWELSADRANAARRDLMAGGMREEQVQQVRGLADRQLRVPEDPLSPRNRRVAITVLLPTEEEAVTASQHGDLPTSTTSDSLHVGAPLPAAIPGGPR